MSRETEIKLLMAAETLAHVAAGFCAIKSGNPVLAMVAGFLMVKWIEFAVRN